MKNVDGFNLSRAEGLGGAWVRYRGQLPGVASSSHHSTCLPIVELDSATGNEAEKLVNSCCECQ